jgi:regulator of replication initiation timing
MADKMITAQDVEAILEARRARTEYIDTVSALVLENAALKARVDELEAAAKKRQSKPRAKAPAKKDTESASGKPKFISTEDEDAPSSPEG